MRGGFPLGAPHLGAPHLGAPHSPQLAPAPPASSRGRGRGRGLGGRLRPLPARILLPPSREGTRSSSPGSRGGSTRQPPAKICAQLGQRAAPTHSAGSALFILPLMPPSIISRSAATQGNSEFPASGSGWEHPRWWWWRAGRAQIPTAALHECSWKSGLGAAQSSAAASWSVFPFSVAWRLQLSRGTAMPEECQITRREVSNPPLGCREK